MHVPVEVDVEDLQEPVTALAVAPSADRVEEVGDHNVRPHDGVHAPFGAEVDDALL